MLMSIVKPSPIAERDTSTVQKGTFTTHLPSHLTQSDLFHVQLHLASYVRAVNFRLRSVGGPLGQNLRLEQLTKGHPELSAHRTVQDEVDGAVQEGQNIHHFPEEIVATFEEALSEDAAHQTQHSLRYFGNKKEQKHGHEHFSGAISPFIRFALPPLGCFGISRT